MNGTPCISVIVPVYNAEKTIERCVNSICGQTFSDLEILLIDDGSGDMSGKLCDALAQKDTRIRVCHQKNGGVSSARNKGVALAKGKYIQFVDSDDYIPDDYCEQLIEAQRKFGEDVFVWAGVRIISENGAVKPQDIRYGKTNCEVASRKDILKLFAKSFVNSPVNKLYHTDYIKKYGLRMNEQISIAEDLLFNLEYLHAVGDCTIVVLNDAAYYYVRNGQASLDNGYRDNYYGIHKKVLRKLWNYCLMWEIPREDYPLYYERYWDYTQSAFGNLERNDCKLGNMQKFWEKSRITADTHFQKSLLQKKDHYGRGSYIMWRSRMYLFVYLYGKIRNRKRH